MMDLDYVRRLVDHLQGRGIRFGPGLTEAEVEVVERRFGWLFPDDLLMLLQYALPISKRFPNWRSGREETLQEILAWPKESVLDSFESGYLWLDSWGDRPSERAESLGIARPAVRRAPTLIPVYSHRYLPAEPILPGNPVFSVYGADTIVYGNDLAGYFHHEFEMPLPDWAAPSPRPILFWTELVG